MGAVFSLGFFEGLGKAVGEMKKGRKERNNSSRKGKKKGNKKKEWNGKRIGERKKEGRQGGS